MNRQRRQWVWTGCALAMLAGLGYVLGRHSAAPAHDRPFVATSVRAPAPSHSRSAAPVQPAISQPLPDHLEELDGTRFIDALPELTRRARNGDAAATDLLFSRLQECSTYVTRSDDDIQHSVDKWYQRQLSIQNDLAKTHPQFLDDPRNVISETTRQASLKREFDKRDRCAALTEKQIEGRLDLAENALARHDREMILNLVTLGYFSMRSPELVRNSDRVVELRDRECRELTRLIDSGDFEALARTALGYSMEGLLPDDPAQAYAYAYAWSLANGGNGKWGMTSQMALLAENRLSAQQVDEARKRGAALFRQCCAARRTSDTATD